MPEMHSPPLATPNNFAVDCHLFGKVLIIDLPENLMLFKSKMEK